MAEHSENKALRSVWPAVVWVVLCATYIVWSYSFKQNSRMFPLMAGYLGLGLGVLDLLSRFETESSKIIRMVLGAGFSKPEIPYTVGFNREIIQMAWMVFFVLMLLFVGVLPAVPVYVLASMRVNGNRSWRESLIASVATLAFVFMVFEVFLDFELYRGVLFDERGFDRW